MSKSSWSHIQKYKYFFNLRVRKFHFLKYKEFFWDGFFVIYLRACTKWPYNILLKIKAKTKLQGKKILLSKFGEKCPSPSPDFYPFHIWGDTQCGGIPLPSITPKVYPWYMFYLQMMMFFDTSSYNFKYFLYFWLSAYIVIYLRSLGTVIRSGPTYILFTTSYNLIFL